MLVGMGRGVQILGCSFHGGESVPPDPMKTGSSRVAHGMVSIVGWLMELPMEPLAIDLWTQEDVSKLSQDQEYRLAICLHPRVGPQHTEG
jgi:hypothetical protein